MEETKEEKGSRQEGKGEERKKHRRHREETGEGKSRRYGEKG